MRKDDGLKTCIFNWTGGHTFRLKNTIASSDFKQGADRKGDKDISAADEEKGF